LEELVRLVGIESLSARERLILDTAKSIREDFLNQHAFDPTDTSASLKKQNILLEVILTLYHQCLQLINSGQRHSVAPELKEEIARLKYTTEDKIAARSEEILEKISSIGKGGK
ncbi:MAG: V-type ATP synthase subunit A, partial [Candidatus Zixiibacteriota bacterium]